MSRRRVVLVVCALAALTLGALLTQRVLAGGPPPCPPPGYCVSVTPDAGSVGVVDAGGEYETNFTLTNTGTLTDSYDVTCLATGGVTCTWGGTTITNVPPGESRTIKFVSFTPGATNGTVKERAWSQTWDNNDLGDKSVTVRPAITFVAPGTTTYSRMPLTQVRFFPSDANIDTTTLVVTVGGDTVTALTRRNRGLVEWELDSLRQLTPGTAKTISVRLCMTNGQCNTVTRNVTLDNTGKPWVSFQGMPLEAHGRVFGAPFGPGLSVSGAEVETGFGVPSYVSMGVARSTGLVYSTRQSHPRALVNVDIELSTSTPSQLKAVLIDGVVRMDSVVLTSPTCSAAVGNRCRVALQGDFAGTTFARPTRKWLKVEVTATIGGTPKVTTDSVEVVLVDRRGSAYGNGWAVGGVLRLDSAGTDMLLTGSTGATTVFRGWGGRYLSPPGDVSVLVWTGSQWELRFRGGGKLIFDAQGRQTKIEDIDGNQVTIAYSGTADRVTSITDPVSKAFTFSYDGSNRLTTITDPGSRANKVTINGSNELTYDSTSSPTTRAYTETFAYTSSGANSAILLRRRANAVSDSTVVHYSSRSRPDSVSLPDVLPETGTSLVRPRIRYAPQETRALGTLISADSAYVTLTDPRGNWTRSALNRWGAAIRTWDALGTLARASFTAEGFVVWSEGKVADSTRVHSTYDTERRLARVYRWRATGDMVRLDSLVYDANHRVVMRVNALGKISSVQYDAEGHVIRTITATNDTTRFWYRTDGLLDSSRSPSQTKSRQLFYDGTWKNVAQGNDGDGRVLFTHALDALGRAYQTDRPRGTRVSGTEVYYQWWSRRVAFNEAGQPISVRTEHGEECTAGCEEGGPPAHPFTSDTAKYDSVQLVYSRVGRDSLRYNIRRQAQLTVYDALGRVRRRYPWYTGHPSEVDWT